MKNYLIAVQGPLQIVAALIAFEWLEKQSDKNNDAKLILLMYDFGVPFSAEDGMVDAIKRLGGIKNWEKIIFIKGADMRLISLQNYSKCKQDLKLKIGYESFDAIFIARDYGSFGTQLILNSYAEAEHIEYGDSLGLVGSENDLKLSWKDIFNFPAMYLKSILKKAVYRHYPKRFKFDKTILSIPIDWSGSYLKDINLIVPAKEQVTHVIFTMAELLSDLKTYSNELVNNEHENYTLVLLSHLTNSRFTTFDNELELYTQIIRDNIQAGNTIILKNHPRGNPEIVSALIKRFKSEYKIKSVNDNYSFYPIELWMYLLNKCQIMPIFSSSAISINYIYSKNVVLTLDEDKIKKYIYKDKQAETIEAEVMNKVALEALGNWDGNSAVWSGGRGN